MNVYKTIITEVEVIESDNNKSNTFGRLNNNRFHTNYLM